MELIFFVMNFFSKAIVISDPKYPKVPHRKAVIELGRLAYRHNKDIKYPAKPDEIPLIRKLLNENSVIEVR